MTLENTNQLSYQHYRKMLLDDYELVMLNRELAIAGRKEVLVGRSQFGIFGDGKELPQLAMAKVFQEGDFRSGYYRDQTFMMAIGEFTVEHFFAQLYNDVGVENEPHSAGRQMIGHFATRSLNEDGSWKDLTKIKNVSADNSPTSGQMPRLLGLAEASKIYRQNNDLQDFKYFSKGGNEVAFGTIGNASCAEGHFFEILNAAGVLQVPMVLSVWDDEYGISVHNDFQMIKSDVSEALEGFRRTEEKPGFEIFKVKGWDYPALVEVYQKAAQLARTEHIPVLVHVVELTQPLGHSSSGSHERYKSAERLQWEAEIDCNLQFRNWLLSIEIQGEKIFSEVELNAIDQKVKDQVLTARKEAWNQFQKPILNLKSEFTALLQPLLEQSSQCNFILPILKEIDKEKLLKRDIYITCRKVIRILSKENINYSSLSQWLENRLGFDKKNISTHLYSESAEQFRNIPEILPQFAEDAPMVDGRIILRDNFEKLFEKYPQLLALGEDVGKIGGVNQTYEGLQEKFGTHRIMDTGICETAIVGRGLGMAMRGLRPIAEIQYLDYMYYAAPVLADDLSSLLYRTAGGQKAPLIISTRGHRLVGIWHSGSPMGALLNMMRGVHVLVPRNLTQAAGFYNTLLQTDEPALVVETLNGYRLKEKMPSNLGEFTVPLGKVEVTKEGADVTLVTYGSTWREVMKAAQELQELGIDAEVVDIQSLSPFDLNHDIVKSVKKTNRLVVIDEDVPGGASAYILQQILERQEAFQYLDSKPLTITSVEHRTPSGFDGDYVSKPQVDDIVEKIYELMREVYPQKLKKLY